MNSRHTLAHALFLINKGSDWLSDSASSRWAWFLSGKKAPWNFIVSGTILMKFRLVGVSIFMIDLPTSRYFNDQHLITYLSSKFGNLTPVIKSHLI